MGRVVFWLLVIITSWGAGSWDGVGVIVYFIFVNDVSICCIAFVYVVSEKNVYIKKPTK